MTAQAVADANPETNCAPPIQNFLGTGDVHIGMTFCQLPHHLRQEANHNSSGVTNGEIWPYIGLFSTPMPVSSNISRDLFYVAAPLPERMNTVLRNSDAWRLRGSWGSIGSSSLEASDKVVSFIQREIGYRNGVGTEAVIAGLNSRYGGEATITEAAPTGIERFDPFEVRRIWKWVFERAEDGGQRLLTRQQASGLRCFNGISARRYADGHLASPFEKYVATNNFASNAKICSSYILVEISSSDSFAKWVRITIVNTEHWVSVARENREDRQRMQQERQDAAKRASPGNL